MERRGGARPRSPAKAGSSNFGAASRAQRPLVWTRPIYLSRSRSPRRGGTAAIALTLDSVYIRVHRIVRQLFHEQTFTPKVRGAALDRSRPGPPSREPRPQSLPPLPPPTERRRTKQHVRRDSISDARLPARSGARLSGSLRVGGSAGVRVAGRSGGRVPAPIIGTPSASAPEDGGLARPSRFDRTQVSRFQSRPL